MLGIVQEQHPDRARLFMQWKQMDWPVMVDSFDLLEVSVVPYTFLIDEFGVIRGKNPEPRDVRSMLIEPEFQEIGEPKYRSLPRKNLYRQHEQEGIRRVDDYQSSKNSARFVEGIQAKEGRAVVVDRLIRAFESKHENMRPEGWTLFRQGVAFRARHDSPRRQSGDFENAVTCWSEALDIDPNNYIWRRRLQQYGPRLDKPYPFYDWVPKAREAIKARGETPFPLTVDPGGAEIAAPAKTFASANADEKTPDPDGRVTRDEAGLILAESVVVPRRVVAGKSARVHVTFSVNEALFAHWNNEGGGLELWIDPPKGWRSDRNVVRINRPEQATSDEERLAEFEIQLPNDADTECVTVNTHALYYVCQGVHGKCLYRRQDIPITISVVCQESEIRE
jgi:hypothetical protein